MRLAVVALKLDTLYENFDGADSQNSASETDELVDEVRLDLRKWVNLIIVVAADYHIPLIIDFFKDVEANAIEGDGQRLGNILGVVTDELQELLHIGVCLAMQLLIIDVNNNLLEVVLLFLPLKQGLCLLSVILAEELIKDLDSKMLEIVWLKKMSDRTANLLTSKWPLLGSSGKYLSHLAISFCFCCWSIWNTSM